MLVTMCYNFVPPGGRRKDNKPSGRTLSDSTGARAGPTRLSEASPECSEVKDMKEGVVRIESTVQDLGL